MDTYRFFSVTESEEVVGDLEIECADDVDARTVGKSLLTESLGIEVWDVGRLVSKWHVGRRIDAPAKVI